MTSTTGLSYRRLLQNAKINNFGLKQRVKEQKSETMHYSLPLFHSFTLSLFTNALLLISVSRRTL